MSKSYDFSNNNFTFIGNSKVGAININNADKNKSIDWNQILEEIAQVRLEYIKKYNDPDDLKCLKELEENARSKNMNLLKKCLDNLPIMLKGFIQALGVSILANLITNGIVN